MKLFILLLVWIATASGMAMYGGFTTLEMVLSFIVEFFMLVSLYVYFFFSDFVKYIKNMKS